MAQVHVSTRPSLTWPKNTIFKRGFYVNIALVLVPCIIQRQVLLTGRGQTRACEDAHTSRCRAYIYIYHILELVVWRDRVRWFHILHCMIKYGVRRHTPDPDPLLVIDRYQVGRAYTTRSGEKGFKHDVFFYPVKVEQFETVFVDIIKYALTAIRMR